MEPEAYERTRFGYYRCWEQRDSAGQKAGSWTYTGISTVRGCSLILQCTPQKMDILMKRLKRLADIFTGCRGFGSITGSRIGQRGAAFLKEHSEYACVHGHMTSTASIYLPEAKRGKIALTAAHARSAGTEGGVKGMMTKRMRQKSLAKKRMSAWRAQSLPEKQFSGKRRGHRGLSMWCRMRSKWISFPIMVRCVHRCGKNWSWAICLTVGHVGAF